MIDLPSLALRSDALRRTALLLAGGSLILALLWASLLYHLYQTREAEIGQARRDVLSLSTALAEQVSRLVAGADQVMSLMEEDLERNPETFDFKAWLARSTSLRTIATGIALFDTRGDVVASNWPSMPRVNVADRPQFAFLAAHPDTGLFIGRTHVGRITGKRVFQINRRISGPDIGAAGSVTLFGLDGFIRARMPAAEGMYDRSVLQIPALHGMFDALGTAPATVHNYASVFDGTMRVYGYRRVAGYPLVVSVGRSLDAALFLFHREVLRTVVLGIVSTGVVLFLLALLLREFGRRDTRERLLLRTQAALGETEAGFRAIFESSADVQVVHRVSPEGEVRVVMVNPAAAAAHGSDVAGRLL